MRRVGRYTLLERLASGPSSEVYLGWADEAAKPSAQSIARAKLPRSCFCAVKVLKPRLAKDRSFSSLLVKEAPAAVRFEHRASSGIWEVERTESDLLIAMELVRGQPIAHVLQRAQQEHRQLSRDMLLWIAAQVASALGAAHERPWSNDAPQPMVHGALSPYNILLTYEGDVKVLGLGLGRSRLLQTPSMPRFAYRAPESLSAGVVDPASDLYALGLVLYEMLSSVRPFRRPTIEEVKAAILEGKLDRLRNCAEHINEFTDELVAQMTDRNPERRPKAAAMVESALRSQIRASEEVITGRLAELMHASWGPEHDVLSQLIHVAKRKVSGNGADTIDETNGDQFQLDELFGPDLTFAGALDDAQRGREARNAVPGPAKPDRPRLADEAPLSPADLMDGSGAAADGPSKARPMGGGKPRPPSTGKDRRSASASGAAPLAGAPQRTTSTPQRIARFEIISELGRIGASNGYEARTTDTKVPVYLKVLDLARNDDQRLRPEEWSACFDRELEIAKSASGNGLPKLVEGGQQNTLKYVAYDRAEGVPLNLVISRGRALSPGAIRRVIASAARALQLLHDQGFVYCNVQAPNILLMRDGQARLNDLSMAARIGGPMHPLLFSNVFSLAPEFLSTESFAPSCDLFALGALLYELLTGTRPFRGLDDRTLLTAMAEKEPMAPRMLESSADTFLSGLAMRILDKSPRNRLGSCAELAHQLEN